MVPALHRTAVKQNADPRVVCLAQALDINATALLLQDVQSMSQCIAKHMPVIAWTADKGDILWLVFYQQE
jgi:hypothetical protein